VLCSGLNFAISRPVSAKDVQASFESAYRTLEHTLDEDKKELTQSKGSSNCSNTLSLVSARAKEMAKLAELKVKANILEKIQALQNEIEKLTLQEKIAVAEAREQAYEQFIVQTDSELKTNNNYGDGMNEYLETAGLSAEKAT
jgi:hypothetical protein